jgi:hypothetical protein
LHNNRLIINRKLRCGRGLKVFKKNFHNETDTSTEHHTALAFTSAAATEQLVSAAFPYTTLYIITKVIPARQRPGARKYSVPYSTQTPITNNDIGCLSVNPLQSHASVLHDGERLSGIFCVVNVQAVEARTVIADRFQHSAGAALYKGQIQLLLEGQSLKQGNQRTFGVVPAQVS